MENFLKFWERKKKEKEEASTLVGDVKSIEEGQILGNVPPNTEEAETKKPDQFREAA